MSRKAACLLVLLFQARLGAHPAGAESSVDLVTPLQSASPRMRFHEGGTQNGQPLVSPDLPPIPGPASDWYVAQWQRPSYLHAADAKPYPGRNGQGWRFATPDGDTSLDIAAQPGGRRAYTLFERDGILTGGGGGNLFLTATPLPGRNDLASPIMVDIDVRITSASVRYDAPDARSSGAVQAMAFVGVGLMFIDPRTTYRRFVFMQLPITVSRPVPDRPGIVCSLDGGQPRLLYAPAHAGLPFRTMAAPRRIRFDLSGAVRGMVAKPYPCANRLVGWPAAETDLADWHFTGLYVGLETQNRDIRQSPEARPAGSASLGLSLLSLTVTTVR